MNGPELYATINGQVPHGAFECYYCGSKCSTFLKVPREDLPIPCVKKPKFALRPGSKFLCIGCWLWKRGRITIPFLSGGWKDIQCPINHSWWMTKTEAFAIRRDNREDCQALYEKLLDPPRCFMLSVVTDTLGTPPINRLQFAVVNEIEGEMTAETVLTFTIDHLKLTYTPYELEMALDNPKELEGKSPGVRALLELLGDYTMPKSKIEMKLLAETRNPKGGRQPAAVEQKNEKSLKKVLRVSGK